MTKGRRREHDAPARASPSCMLESGGCFRAASKAHARQEFANGEQAQENPRHDWGSEGTDARAACDASDIDRPLINDEGRAASSSIF
jgi:hypothetical protein